MFLLKNKFNPVLFFLMFNFMFFLACQSNIVFKEERKITNDVWRHDDVLKWQFQMSDSVAVFNLLLDVVHADSFPFQNLYLKLKMTHPDGKQLVRTASFPIFNQAGEPLGKWSDGKIASRLTLQPDAYFAVNGTYGLEIEQFTRNQQLPVNTVTFVIEKTLHRR